MRRGVNIPKIGAARLVLACTLALLSCSAPVREYRCVESASAARLEGRELWDCQHEIIDRAVRGKEFTLQELRGAAAYFEALTGIAADVDWTSIGPVPRPGLRESLRRWDLWLVDHIGELKGPASDSPGF